MLPLQKNLVTFSHLGLLWTLGTFLDLGIFVLPNCKLSEDIFQTGVFMNEHGVV